jgi:hypothetical protein
VQFSLLNLYNGAIRSERNCVKIIEMNDNVTGLQSPLNRNGVIVSDEELERCELREE